MDVDNVVTSDVAYLIDVLQEEPTAGSRVFGLQHGGCLVQTVWGGDSAKQYDAWCRFPTVPQNVKQRQMARYSKVIT